MDKKGLAGRKWSDPLAAQLAFLKLSRRLSGSDSEKCLTLSGIDAPGAHFLKAEGSGAESSIN